MYYLEKMGVYSHGIFWIGTIKKEGIKQANLAAKSDRDDYHSWEVRKFTAISNPKDYDDDGSMLNRRVYSKVKGKKGVLENEK